MKNGFGLLFRLPASGFRLLIHHSTSIIHHFFLMELFRALASLVEPPDEAAGRVAAALGLGPAPGAAEHTEVFVFQLYPYASVYLGAEGMLGGEARDRVAGFWRALGQSPPAEADHLSVMLALYARLCELEAEAADARAREGWRGARKAFLWEHLLSWLPAYLAKLEETGAHFYRGWARVLAAALAGEAAGVGPQATLAIHLREHRPVADPRASSADEFVASLLAPARSGLILVRADLARAARELDLAPRPGGRAFVLKSLMGQDARAVLGRLAREAEAWAARHASAVATYGAPAEAWEVRAAHTARLLRELESSAGEFDT
jgi:TorA maturation chaperone TorD